MNSRASSRWSGANSVSMAKFRGSDNFSHPHKFENFCSIDSDIFCSLEFSDNFFLKHWIKIIFEILNFQILFLKHWIKIIFMYKLCIEIIGFNGLNNL